jgi:hypothetical protein
VALARTLRTSRCVILTAFFTGVAGGVSAQAARMSRDDNFRREPNGVVLGRLASGAPFQVLTRQENWLQVDVEGWVWLESLQASTTDLDLVVTASGGENLRGAPSGAIIGRLEEGALLEEVARQPGWARVKRRGWVWSASVAMGAGATAPATGSPATAARPPSAAPPSAAPTPPARPVPAARQPTGYASVGSGGAAILASPDGDTLAMAVPDRDLQVVSREGNWVRVRLDGWVWLPASDPGAGALDTTPSTLVPQDLATSPDAHVGRVVAWALQFISLERAEAIRTDFRQGEPFMLTRYGGPDGPFVYVAVPAERLAAVQGLVPLERISVTARVRTGATSLNGTPIVDLLSFERNR